MGNAFASGPESEEPATAEAPEDNICHVHVIAGGPWAGVSSFVKVAAGGEFDPESLRRSQRFPAFQRIRTDTGVELWLWDEPTKDRRGLDHVRSHSAHKYSAADVLALAVDLAEARSDQVPVLRRELAKYRGVCSAPVVLLGLRADQPPPPEPTDWDVLAAELGAVAFVRTSAKTGEGVAEALAAFARCSPATRRRLRSRVALVWCKRQGGASGFARRMGRLPEHLFRRVAQFV